MDRVYWDFMIEQLIYFTYMITKFTSQTDEEIKQFKHSGLILY